MENILKYKGIYSEVYNLHKEFADKEMSDEDFKAYRQEMIRLSNKYGNTQFVIDFLHMVGEELSRERLKREGAPDGTQIKLYK